VADDSPPVKEEIAEEVIPAAESPGDELLAAEEPRRPLAPLPELSRVDVVRSCGNAVFELDGDQPTNTTELSAELRDVVEGTILAKESYEWSLIHATDEFVSLFGFDSSGYHGFAFLELQEDVWVPVGFGDCQMRLEIDGVWTLGWWPAGDLDESTTTFEIVEDSCRGDEVAYGPEHVAVVVVEDAAQVTVMMVAAPLPPAPVSDSGDIEGVCWSPSDPVTLTVELSEPIGDRRVMSGIGEPIYLPGD
jgi:hypothetical protein